MPADTAVLEESNDEKGLCVRRVSLSSGVERLRRAMGLSTEGDLVSALAAEFRGPGGSSRLEKFLESQGIESEFWNRIGD